MRRPVNLNAATCRITDTVSITVGMDGTVSVIQADDPVPNEIGTIQLARFINAAGLVMEVGGLMTHGSVVAREYGIPAVMGTGVATKRIPNGEIITVDGNAGTVTIMNGDALQ